MENKKFFLIEDYKEMNILPDNIPIDDIEAYKRNPHHRFVYNRLFLMESQNIDAAPMGVNPPKFPVVKKTIYCLNNKHADTLIGDVASYNDEIEDGFFWHTKIGGLSTFIDVMYNGEFIVFVNAYNYKERSYYQTIENFIIPLEAENWIHKCLKGYKGIINLEIKNDIIVDVRLTLGDLVHFYNYEFFDEIDNFFQGTKATIDFDIESTTVFTLFIPSEALEKFKKNMLKYRRFFDKNSLVNSYLFLPEEESDDIDDINVLFLETPHHQHGEEIIHLIRSDLGV